MNSKEDQRVQRLEEGLWRSCRRLGLRSRTVLLGVSGGADSLTLMSGLARLSGRLGLTVEACTVDHGLRAEGPEEVEVVGGLAREWGIPHHARRVALTQTEGLEAEARAARYRALEQLRVERRLDLVVTAHTASDQAETVLMRLARGSALGGARGIHEQRADRVVRPLLFATREEVLAYAAARQLPVQTDPMNADPSFLRVRVRQELLPTFATVAGPEIVRALARFATFAAEDDDALGRQAIVALRRAAFADGTLELEAVRAMERAIGRRVLALWLHQARVEIDAELIEEAWRAVHGGGVATLPGARLLACANGRVTLQDAPPRLHSTSSG